MADFEELVRTKTEALRAPIAGASPGGSDVSYDPSFEKLKGEIDKLSSVGGEQPDWKSVVELSTDILSGKAKDFRAAVWLTTARLFTGGWQGFAEGLTVLHALTDEYWDTMFPEARRARARGNLMTWMAERASPKVQELSVRLADGDAVRKCDTLLDAIDSTLAEKVGDAYGGLGDLKMVMRGKVRDIPEPPPPPPSAPEPGAAPSESSSSSSSYASSESSAMPAMSSPEDVDNAMLTLGQSIVEASRVLRASDPANPWAYRLARVGVWLPIRMVPPNDGGATMIPGPDTSMLSTFEGLAGSQSWMELLNTAEEAASQGLFWLDPHRYVALAMDRLGALFLGAREALGRELAAYLARHPQMAKLTFSDGTPFAGPATRSFLEEEAAKFGGGGGGKPSAANAEDEELATRVEEAKALVQGGQIAEGLSLANALSNRLPDARRRFRARTLVARLALEGGRAEIARAMFDGLAAEIDRHGLEVWEPEVCAPVYRGLIDCLALLTADETTFARRASLFEKLCRIDPGAAFAIETTG